MGVISIPSDKKDAMICVDKMYQDAVVAEAVEDAVATNKNKKRRKVSMDAREESEKRTSPEFFAPVDDLPESSTSKRS